MSIGYALRLPLGPTNPGIITIVQETLLFRPWGFSPHLWLLIPAFSLPNAPQFLTDLLHCDRNAPLPRLASILQTYALVSHTFKNSLDKALL